MTGNPQQVDLILDAACYADMLDAAKESGISLAVRLVETKIDLTNLMTCLRLIRMDLGSAGEAFLQESLLSGGTVATSILTEAYAAGESALAEQLAYSRYLHRYRIRDFSSR